LRTAGERQAFFKDMQKEGKRGFTNTELKKFLGKKMTDNSDRFSSKKIRALSKIFYRNGKSYIICSGKSSSQSVPSKIQKIGKPKPDMNKIMQEIRSKRRTPNGNLAGQFPSPPGRLSPGAPPVPPRLGQPGMAMTGAQFNQQFFKRGGSNLGLAGVAGTRH